MTRKYDTILQLAKDTEKKVVRDAASWMDFLFVAGHFYKYPFQDQMLIYAQRPDATACASMELWNQRMNCWVNKGAKGIALIDDLESKSKLKYVFDIADVHKARRIGRFPYFWKVKPEQEEVVLQHLKQIDEETIRPISFTNQILELSARVVSEIERKVTREMQFLVEDSFLEELDQMNLSIRIRETMKESIAYLILSGCGIPREVFQEEFSFDFISEFNTTDTLALLGYTIQEQTKPIMLEIKNTVRFYEKQQRRVGKKISLSQMKEEKKEKIETTFIYSQSLRKKGVEKENFLDYNELRKDRGQNQIVTQKTEGEEERSVQDGTDLQKGGRLSDSRYRDGRTAGGRTSEIWSDAETVSEGTQRGSLHRNVAFQQADAASAGEAGRGGGTVGLYYKANGKDRGNDRGTQEHCTNALGSVHEQHCQSCVGFSA